MLLKGLLNDKTFKREVALIALAFWSVVTYRMFWALDVPHIEALDAAYGTISTTVWLYTAAAFGMDAAARQLQAHQPRRRGGPSPLDYGIPAGIPTGVQPDLNPPPGYGE